jgi:RNA polymerase sigma-70 factor (ECF subfamily)
MKGCKEFNCAEEISDKVCILKTLEGETEFFGILVKRYQNHIFNIVNKMVRNSDISKDIVQEAFLRSFKSLSSFDSDKDFFPYLVCIAVNCAKDYLKKCYNEVDLVGIVVPDTTEDVVDYTDLYDAIYSLPLDYREVFLLFYRDGKSIKEIATAFNKTPGNVKVILFRAREMLFKKLNS